MLALAKLASYQANALLRKRYTVEHQEGNHVIVNAKPAVQFCSNDYLHISTHSNVKKAWIDGAHRYGLGSGASALVSGHTKAHALLEDAFANFLNRDKALLFNSGYHANLGVLATFAHRQTNIIADKLCHASLIDGAMLSRANLRRYAHNNMQQAEQLLAKQKDCSSLLISESIFSIHGDIAKVQTLSALASHYQHFFIVDDAHGIGVLGEKGGGIAEHYQLSQQDLPCLITPLGKALGSMGAIVSGSESTIYALLQFARTYRYSTALPPALCLATLAALDLIQKETWRRQTLTQLIHTFIAESKKRGLTLLSSSPTPIKSILIGSNKEALSLQEALLNKGFFISCIRPPTVPKHETCLRISLNCMHKETQIIQLLDLIAEKRRANAISQ